ncbi:EPIDERMAL PATTERNING FACTOR-like protein 2, partial [Zingiber officinale]|uniref:EPIDERMAL PATTERNING FACTOR-like protein 2 n=1 Tax=Zingiber officinale TaxID=94328 RepID=UPI001C4AAE48
QEQSQHWTHQFLLNKLNGTSPLYQPSPFIASPLQLHITLQLSGGSLSILPEIASGRGEGKVRALIGSRPPTCEKRCRTCSHCEAIQVPVITQKTKTRTKKESLDLASNLSGDFNSNYKPLSWKCKCGSIVFDP